MRMGVRETWGSSWRGRQPGTRHWRSHSVYLSWWFLPFYAAAWFMGALLLVYLWALAEIACLFATALIVVIGMLVYRQGPQHIRVVRHGWFVLLDLDTEGR